MKTQKQRLQRLFESVRPPEDLPARIEAALDEAPAPRRWPWAAAAASVGAVATAWLLWQPASPQHGLIAHVYEHVQAEAELSGRLDHQFTGWLAERRWQLPEGAEVNLVKTCKVQGMPMKHLRLADGDIELFVPEGVLHEAGAGGRIHDRRWRLFHAASGQQVLALYTEDWDVAAVENLVKRVVGPVSGV